MVIQWRQRFAKERLAGLADRPRSGRPRTYTDADRGYVWSRRRALRPLLSRLIGVCAVWPEATGVGRDAGYVENHDVSRAQERSCELAAKVLDMMMTSAGSD